MCMKKNKEKIKHFIYTKEERIEKMNEILDELIAFKKSPLYRYRTENITCAVYLKRLGN